MALEQVLADWGLPAIAAGSFLEGEGAAFMGGVLAHRGFFPFEAAALAAALGALCVDQAVFHIGRHLTRFPRARGVLERPRTRKVAGWVRAHPDLLCLSFRFLYGLKTVGALTLGAAAIPPVRFFALDLVGCLVWAHAVTALGFGAGHAVERVFGRIETHHHLVIALVLAALLLGAAELLRRLWRPGSADASGGDVARGKGGDD